jgi:hypothetical protein
MVSEIEVIDPESERGMHVVNLYIYIGRESGSAGYERGGK